VRLPDFPPAAPQFHLSASLRQCAREVEGDDGVRAMAMPEVQGWKPEADGFGAVCPRSAGTERSAWLSSFGTYLEPRDDGAAEPGLTEPGRLPPRDRFARDAVDLYFLGVDT